MLTVINFIAAICKEFGATTTKRNEKKNGNSKDQKSFSFEKVKRQIYYYY